MSLFRGDGWVIGDSCQQKRRVFSPNCGFCKYWKTTAELNIIFGVIGQWSVYVFGGDWGWLVGDWSTFFGVIGGWLGVIGGACPLKPRGFSPGFGFCEHWKMRLSRVLYNIKSANGLVGPGEDTRHAVFLNVTKDADPFLEFYKRRCSQ